MNGGGKTGRPSTPCAVAGCERPARYFGHCRLHRRRLLATGDPLTVRRERPAAVAPEARGWQWMADLGEAISQCLHAVPEAVLEAYIEQTLTPEMRQRRAAILSERARRRAA